MNTKKGITAPVTIALIAFAIVVLGIAYVNFQPEEEIMMDKGEAMMNEGKDMMDKGEAMMNEGKDMMDDAEKMMESTTTNDAMMESEDSMMEGGAMMEEHTYSGAVLAGTSAPLVEYTKKDYDKAIADGKVVFLYFYANWCPICKEEQPILFNTFNNLSADNIVGFRVNYKDSETDKDEEAIAREQGISSQHTKVIIKNGVRVLKSPEQWDKARYDQEIAHVL